MASGIEELKKKVFFDMLDISGRVFVAIGYGDDVVIGKRGFLPQEKEQGLVLVFNRKMKFTWDEAGVSATLVFGTSPEKCFIPHERIMTIFSPELNAQFSLLPEKTDTARQGVPEKEKTPDYKVIKKVIKVDFSKKKK